MERSIDLTKGNILNSLIRLAMPIIGTSFVQMAYNFTDMIWVGRIGSAAVAAVGTAGYFTWLSMALITIPRIGAEVGVAQALGRQDYKGVKESIRHSIQMIVVLAMSYAALLILLRRPLVGFYNLGAKIEKDAIDYLVIICLGMVFGTLNPVFTAIFNGAGDSKTPFRINSLGLVLNIILDPLLILGIGPFPRLEVKGAAIATVIAQALVTIVFILEAKRRPELFAGLHLLQKPDFKCLKKITLLGLPVALQSAFFTLIAMVIAKIISKWGPLPIAVQKVGSQIESISWMTAAGFQSAMSAFMGQNYGAGRWDRIYRGYLVGLGIASVIGIFASAVLFFGAKPIFTIFISEAEAVVYGIIYLKIFAMSQFFMALEIITAGAFIGQGKTAPPSIVSTAFNLLRIPGALLLSATALGLKGVWWAVSISSVLKGVVMCVWYMAYINRNPHIRELKLAAENM